MLRDDKDGLDLVCESVQDEAMFVGF